MSRRYPPLQSDDPERLGPYQLSAVLGAGGMGRVYLGRSTGPGGTVTPVAVKVLLPELVHEEELVRRFAREAHAARRVRGGRVARVLGHSQAGGTEQPWIATEFLAGPTLAEALAEYGPFDPAAVHAVGAALCAALRDIHRAGLVHRDLKPANVVLTAGGPKVIDFGIARPEHGLTLTATGQVAATPGYAAPEQLLGRRSGPAADIFALGALLVRIATGRSAFPATDPLLVSYRVVHEDPDLTGLPDASREILAGCLAKDPRQRPTAARLRRLLAPRRRLRTATEPFWRDGPVAAEIAARERDVRQAVGGAAPARAGLSRRRLLTGVGAGGGVLLAGGAALVTRTAGDGPTSNGAATSPTERVTDAEPLAEYVTGVAPDPYWEVTDAAEGPAGARPVPVGAVVVVPAPDGDGLAGYRVDAVGSGATAWVLPEADPTAGYLAAGPPDDPVLLAADSAGTVLGCDPDTGETRWRADVAAALLLAGDESAGYLLTAAHTLVAVATEDGTVRWEEAPGTLDAAALSDDGGPDQEQADGARAASAAAAAGHGRLVVCDGARVVAFATDTGEEAWQQPGDYPLGPLPPVLTAEVCCHGGGALVALALSDGSEVWRQEASGADGWSAPSVSRDGRICATDRLDLVCREVADGRQQWSARVGQAEELPPHPPVVQGNGVWTVLGGSGTRGVAVRRLDDGAPAWTYSDGQTGDWTMAGDGNRVFLRRAGTLRAMPVP